ncbi:MAG: UDP-2,3-diacylglucosamine diphosphatase [Flavobacteriaceae bacterium]|nr:UDP-2,3-diacylglucosamine diphosphatase [Flavobacteriaceae bacterium]
MKKRPVDIVIISDVHLGTYGCHATELLEYLKSINPNKLILNGDIIDIWQFKKWYFPESHLRVIKKLIALAANGTEVIYITGNHDEMLRKFVPGSFGNISLVNKVVLNLNGKKVWIFHGDVFDASIQHTKWIAKLGSWGYDVLILTNRWINWCLIRLGRNKYSLSKKIKNSVKQAVKFISDFETTASELAIENSFDYVACGHIHQPQIQTKTSPKGSCIYLNSGDWIENLTALEYDQNEWSLYTHPVDTKLKTTQKEKPVHINLQTELLNTLNI